MWQDNSNEYESFLFVIEPQSLIKVLTVYIIMVDETKLNWLDLDLNFIVLCLQ